MTPLLQDFSDAAKRAACNPAVAAALAGVAIAGCNAPPPPQQPHNASAGSSAVMDVHPGAKAESSSVGSPTSPEMGESHSTMPETSSIPNAHSARAEESSAVAEEQSSYRNGTYAATGNYVSPAGMESVDVTLTLQDDVITEATFVGHATHQTSVKLQGMFAEGFRSAVVGRPIDTLNLTVVNGSSLTPKGFMDAVAKIKAEARAS